MGFNSHLKINPVAKGLNGLAKLERNKRSVVQNLNIALKSEKVVLRTKAYFTPNNPN